MSRTAIIKLRVTPDEKTEAESKALALGVSLSDCVRLSLVGRSVRLTPEEKERLRLLARAGNNLNQLARWANTYKDRTDTMAVLLALDALWCELTTPESCSEDICT